MGIKWGPLERRHGLTAILPQLPYEKGMWGGNISDSRIFMENKKKLFYIKPENLNEKIAKASQRRKWLCCRKKKTTWCCSLT